MKQMKDSGIEWIGSMPHDWELRRIQYCLNEVKVKNNPIQTSNILSLVKDKGVMPYEEKGNQGNKAKEDVNEYHLAYPNTLVVNSMNILIGSVGISKHFGCVSPVYYVFGETDVADLRFINYIFNTRPFQKELRKYANGILEIRLRVSAYDIFKRKVALPSKSVQIKIADFLDHECEKIDGIIADIQSQIEVLEQYKRSVITEAVTKGLNPDAVMKDSGIEWIKKIPSNWSTNKMKYLFSFKKGLSITKENLIDVGLPVISYGQIHSKANKGTNISENLLRFVSFDFQRSFPSAEVKQNDFVFADTSEDYEGCGNCAYKREDSLLFGGYHVIIAHSIIRQDNRYFAYLFQTDAWKNQIRKRASGIKVFSITQKIISNSTVIVPPVDIQRKIADQLDQTCEKINDILTKKQEQIDVLEKYRKSLIYEYVTGKKEVI